MFHRLSTINKCYASVRIIADLILVHLSMVAAFAAVALFYLTGHKMVAVNTLTQSFGPYYSSTFLLSSLVFPIVFLLTGLYTRHPSYQLLERLLHIVRSTTVATLLFLGIQVVVPVSHPIPRSVLLAFCLFAAGMIAGARLLKQPVLRYFADPSEPAAPAEGPVLVIGGAGYIGSNMVRRLLENGRKVRVLDNLVYGYDAIKDVMGNPDFELIVGDCRNIKSVVGAVKGASAIVHLAAIVGDPACEHDKKTALEINYAATRMVAEVARGAGIERFVFASSCSVYGANERMVDEQSPVNPISVYAQTKVDSESALLASRSATFHPTILRFATVFGNSYRPRFDLVVNLLTARANQEKLITIYNGQQWRPFIHVRDIAESIVLILNSPLASVSGEIFNVGDSRLNYTLGQIADIISGIFPGTQVEHVDNHDRRDYRVCFDKIRKRLGFQCRWTIEEGILELKRAFEEGTIVDYTDPYYNNIKYLQSAGSPSNTDAMDIRVMAAFAGDRPTVALSATS
jgi:nucleoside-diphosphate-sugar epimerase